MATVYTIYSLHDLQLTRFIVYMIERRETSPFTKSSIEDGGREGDISLHEVLH